MRFSPKPHACALTMRVCVSISYSMPVNAVRNSEASMFSTAARIGEPQSATSSGKVNAFSICKNAELQSHLEGPLDRTMTEIARAFNPPLNDPGRRRNHRRGLNQGFE